MMPPLYRPFRSLLDGWEVKVPIALMGTGVVEIGQKLVGVYATILSMNLYLVAAAVMALTLDTMTGIAATVKEHGTAELSSTRFRTFGWKLIEYTSVVMVFTGLDNASAGTFAQPLFSTFSNGSLLYVTLTEAWSVAENWGRLGMWKFVSTSASKGLSQAIRAEVEQDGG